MTEFNPFMIDFYVTYVNGAPVATVLNSPQPPTSSNITTLLEELITFIQSYGINFQSFSLINGQIEQIMTNYKSSPKSSPDVIDQFDKTKSSATSKEALLSNLNILITMIKGDGETTTYTTPDMETNVGTPPAIVGNLRTKRLTGQANVEKFQGVGEKVKFLQTDVDKLNTSYVSFITKVKSSFLTMNSSTNNSTMNSTVNNNSTMNSSVNNSNIATSKKTTALTTTTGKTPSGVPNNFINNIAAILIGTRKLNKTRYGGKTNTPVVPPEISSFQYSAPTQISKTTSSVQSTSDYYEISTSQSQQSGLINLTYSYYPGGSQTSSFACTFSLLTSSLSSLSFAAFTGAVNSNNQVKNELVENSGYGGSTSPTNNDLWISYLIWLYSYLSTGVSSQLGFGNITPFPQLVNGSVNYMIDYDYMQKVGNFGLTVQQSTMDSDDAAILGVSIPASWPSLMYSFDPDKKYGGQEQYMGKSIVNTIKKHTSTS